MNFNSKKTSLIILGATAIFFSRVVFFLLNDSEGPNLVIVLGLAITIYTLSLVAYVFMLTKVVGLKKISIIVFIQILSVISLYACMK